jgi:hypothetical protein
MADGEQGKAPAMHRTRKTIVGIVIASGVVSQGEGEVVVVGTWTGCD